MTITKEIETLKNDVVSKLDEMKAENIEVIDISSKSTIADYMVVATGRSDRHIDSTADAISLEMKQKYGLEGLRPKGIDNNGWVVLDLGDVIVHLFTDEVRSLYKIEELWKTRLKQD